jgi:hypothetical protein
MIIDAYAEWDDPHAFRVYLVEEYDEFENKPLKASYTENDTHGRLFRACFLANPKDFAGQTVGILWSAGRRWPPPSERPRLSRRS